MTKLVTFFTIVILGVALINASSSISDLTTYRMSKLSCTDGKSSFNIITIKTTAINENVWCTYPLTEEPPFQVGGKSVWIAKKTCFINMPMVCRTEATEGTVKSSEITIRD